MAQLPGAFNPKDHDEMGSYEALPIGDYVAKITESEKKESNRSPGNYYWKLTFEIIEGKAKGRKVWTNLNLINRNPDAVEIAQRELTSICKACGVGAIENTDELHGKPLVITLKMVPATPKYPESNAISGYKRVEGLATPSAPSQKEVEEEVADENGKMPWDE
jgi:hypothetical protein